MATKKCATARLHARITRSVPSLAGNDGNPLRRHAGEQCLRGERLGAVTSIPAPWPALRGTDFVPVGSALLTRCPPPAMLRTKTAEGETCGRERPWATARRAGFRHASLGAILECGGLPPLWPRRAGSPAQPSVFAGNRYWRGRKRWQATALQDRLSLGGNAVVCLRSGPYDGRKENSSRTVPESGRSSSAGAQHTACPHAARYDVHRIGAGSS